MSVRRKRKNRRKKNRGSLYLLLSFFVIIVLIIVGMSVFFKITKIEVSGASKYSDMQIREASLIKEGDNLFFINKNNTAREMLSSLPYLDSVRIESKPPNTVTLKITECEPLAVVVSSGYYWLIDKKGKLLERVSYDTAQNYIAVTGIDVLGPEAGAIIEVSEAESDKKAGLTQILSKLYENGMTEDVGEIDVKKAYDIYFRYMERFDVRIGIREDIDYKIILLKSVIPQLATNERGTIDLSDNKMARFIPERTESPQEQAPDAKEPEKSD